MLMMVHGRQAMKRLKEDVKAVHAEHERMLQRLRTCQPPPASLGAHLLALTDPATGRPLTDAQLCAEMVTFFIAGTLSSNSHPAAGSYLLTSSSVLRW